MDEEEVASVAELMSNILGSKVSSNKAKTILAGIKMMESAGMVIDADYPDYYTNLATCVVITPFEKHQKAVKTMQHGLWPFSGLKKP